jgi:hypothetical protein
VLPELIAGKRKQGNVPGAFHGNGNLALVLCARPGLAAGTDLSVFGYVVFHQFDVFIIDNDILVRTKLTHPRPGIKTPATA